MSSASTPAALHPHWSYKTTRYKSFLNFRSRADCLRHAFDVAAATKLKGPITLIHPDGTEEVVTRDDYERNR